MRERHLLVLLGIGVLLAPSILLAWLSTRSGELGGLLLVPAFGLAVFELVVWWWPLRLAVEQLKWSGGDAAIFLAGALVCQLPWPILLAVDGRLTSWSGALIATYKVLVPLVFWRWLRSRSRSC